MKLHQEQLVKASLIRGLDKVLSDRQIDSSFVEKEFSIGWDQFSDEDNLVPARLLMSILKRVKDLTHGLSFLMDLVDKQDSSLLGSLSLLMESSSCPDQALSDYVNYQQRHNPGVIWSLRYEGDYAYFSLDSGRSLGLSKEMTAAFSMSQAWGFMRSIGGRNLRLARVEMSCEQPEKLISYKKFYAAPIQFSAEEDQLVFYKDGMFLEREEKDERVYSLVREHLSKNKGDVNSMVETVSQLIRQLLTAGNCSVDVVSKMLSCDKRTLQRELQVHGTSYRELIDSVRNDMALNYLEQRHISLTQVAMLVGYTDVSNFSRAFKKHVGISPRAWRKEKGLLIGGRFTRSVIRHDGQVAV